MSTAVFVDRRRLSSNFPISFKLLLNKNKALSIEQKINANQHVQRHDILCMHAVKKQNMWNDALVATVYEENKKKAHVNTVNLYHRLET